MAKRPVIGVPCSAVAELWGVRGNGNGVNYLRAIEAAGGIPQLIHLSQDEEVLVAHYERCDGLLLAGGHDVHPSCYRAALSPKLGSTDQLQDAVEITLARHALADGMPILGVCRGIQMLNVVMGGTLYQDIPSELPNAIDHEASWRQKQMGHLAHAITFSESSWLAAQLDTAALDVNTAHHQALRDIAPGLEVVARAPDGLVEAVESNDSRFIVGVQCHPEELWDNIDTRWARMFEGFVAASRS